MAGQDSLSSRPIGLDEALDKSLALLQRGKTPEDCLSRFPEHAEELRPLLEVAARIWRVPPPTPSLTHGTNGKQRMLEALAQKEGSAHGLGTRFRAWIDALFKRNAGQGIDFQRRLGSAAVAAAIVILIAAGAVAIRSWQGVTVHQQAILASHGGLVEVLPLGAEAWLPVSEAMLVEAGDRIRTGAEGAAKLTFFDGSVTELRPMAELSIARMTSQRSGNGQVIVLHQWLGESHNQVEPFAREASRFSLQTASAVLSVRGTAFTVIVEPDGTTLLEVEEGVVAVQTRETSMLVSGGEEVLVPSPLMSATPTTSTTPEPTGASGSPTPTEPSETSSPTESPESLEMTEVSPTPTLGATQTTQAVATPLPTSTGTVPPTETESPAPTATDSSPSSTTEPSPTETDEPLPTATESSPTETQPPPTATEEPLPTETNPPPTETESPPTETKPPPTATDLPPTATQPPPTETKPPPTATESPPTPTEPPPTEPPPTETKVKETPPGQTKTPEPPGQTKTPEPPGQNPTPESLSDDGADLSRRVGSGSPEQDRRTPFLDRTSFLIDQLNTGAIWLGILIVVLPLSLLPQDER